MKLQKLRQLVKAQYEQNDPNQADWAEYLYPNHVLLVAQKSEQLCQQYGGDADIAVAGALLHDIADSIMGRDDSAHKEKSYEIGRNLCAQAGYSKDEISVIIDDISTKHSCRDNVAPDSLEGRIVSTADAWAHMNSDFYLFAFSQVKSAQEFMERKTWMAEHLTKDFDKKMFFKDIKEELYPMHRSLLQITNTSD